MNEHTTMPSVPLVAQRSYVDGEWLDLDLEIGTLADPNTGKPRQPMLDTPAVAVERALAAAQDLYLAGDLERVSLEERAAVLTDIADKIDGISEQIAAQDSINTGIPFARTKAITSFLGARIRSAVTEALEVGDSRSLPTDDGRIVKLLRKPLGPALIIAPWNAPTFTAVGKIASALMAGCPVILKPSEVAPSGCQLIAEIVVEVFQDRGFPPASFQQIHGGAATGSVLSSDTRVGVISFTGGVPSGRKVALAAASNITNVHLELGSNNPGIVLADADIDETAASIAQGMTRLNGQWCEAPDKILVIDSVHDRFVEALTREVAKLAVGHAFDEGTDVGPLAYEQHRDRIRETLRRLELHGGTVVSPTATPTLGGWFIPPSFVVGVDASHATEELFAPVVTVHSVSTVDEALRHANAPGGGLDGFVFGSDEEAAIDVASRIHAGEVRVNGTFMADLADHSEQAFWGTSGVGGHGTRFGVRLFSGERVVGVDHADAPL